MKACGWLVLACALMPLLSQAQQKPATLQANAALAALGDNESVFFIDISDRFFPPRRLLQQ
jgi:hypothetical protein